MNNHDDISVFTKTIHSISNHISFSRKSLRNAYKSSVFTLGFNGRNLPPGGWTHWFNVDHPGGAGDYETVDNIVRMYGRGCAGLPCRRPLAIKVASVYGLRPSEEGTQPYRPG